MAKQLPSDYGDGGLSPIRIPRQINLMGNPRGGPSGDYDDDRMLSEITADLTRSMSEVAISSQEAANRVRQIHEALEKGLISYRTFWELLDQNQEEEMSQKGKDSPNVVLDFWDTL